jgi:hypothetical protein
MTCPIVLIRRKPHLHRRTFRPQHRLAGVAEFQCHEDRGSHHDLGRNPNRRRRADDIGNSAPGNGEDELMDTKFPFQLSIRPPARAVSSTEHVLHLNVKRRRLSPSRAWLVRITGNSEVIPPTIQFHMPGKFYKGESQEKYLAHGRMFSCFPARMIEQDFCSSFRSRCSVCCASSRSGFGFHSQQFHRFFATRPVCSETSKQSGDQVLTMVLSGTRGLDHGLTGSYFESEGPLWEVARRANSR